MVSGAQNWFEKGGTRLEQGMGHWDWLLWPLYQPMNTQIWTLGGPKIGLNRSIWLLWSPNGLWCPKLVGKGWNKIGTGYGALELTTLTTLAIHKYPNLDPRGSQNGSKWVYMGYKWSMVPQKWLEQDGMRLEQGIPIHGVLEVTTLTII